MGRPKKYTKKALAEAVDRYFASITRVIPLTEKYDTGRRDADGHKVYEERPVLNSLGEQATVEEYIVPPTVGALCMALGIHRSTWADYCDPAEHPEFKDITVAARERLRTYLEQQLLVRKDVRGVIFDLQNNHGYTEKRQVDLSERASKAVSVAAVPLSEKMALLREIAQDFQEEAGTDVQADS